MADYPYVWRWRVKHGERHGQRCRVWARGAMNSIGVEFQDGFRTVTARYAVRKAPQPPASTPLAPLPAQLDLDGRPHELAPQTERLRLFEPVEQLPGQTRLGVGDWPPDSESDARQKSRAIEPISGGVLTRCERAEDPPRLSPRRIGDRP